MSISDDQLLAVKLPLTTNTVDRIQISSMLSSQCVGYAVAAIVAAVKYLGNKKQKFKKNPLKNWHETKKRRINELIRTCTCCCWAGAFVKLDIDDGEFSPDVDGIDDGS